jgi:hypothetical protein
MPDNNIPDLLYTNYSLKIYIYEKGVFYFPCSSRAVDLL